MAKNGRFRKKESYYTQVSNYPIVDVGLSLKALGLYTRINHYITIPDFELYKVYLLNKFKERETAFDGAWNELKSKGYLIQHKMQDEKGLIYWEYELLDEPIHTPKIHPMDNPPMDNPPHGKSMPGKPPLYNKTLTNKTLTNNNKENKLPSKGNNLKGTHHNFQKHDWTDVDFDKYIYDPTKDD